MTDASSDEVGNLSADDKQVSRCHFMKEREAYVDAARESARTFDQAMLAFGTAAFGGSIVFLKDVASKPTHCSLIFLSMAWGLFSLGLLALSLSFLFSHRACMAEINFASKMLIDRSYEAPQNRWSTATTICNYSSVGMLFVGLVFWSVFAIMNLGR